MSRFFYACIILFAIPNACKANWVDLNTGINDDLTGVVVWGDSAAVTGNKGLYYTLNNFTTWTRYDVIGNTPDSIIYNNTKFSHSYADISDSYYVFACGQDTVNNKAVVMKFSLITQTHTLIYYGAAGTSLKNIGYCNPSDTYYAVGNNGLIVSFNSVTGTPVPSVLTQDLTSISFSGSNCSIGSVGNEIYGLDNNPGLSITTNIVQAGWNLQDVWLSSANDGFSAGNAIYYLSAGTTETFTNYDFGPLNAQCIYKFGAYRFVGTDHGIFRLNGGVPTLTNPFEWQYTSGQNSIREIWSEDPPTTDMFACGDNGVLLQSSNFGGGTVPYVTISSELGCAGSTVTITAENGSANDCEWYIDGVYYGSNCGSLSNYFDTAGVYQIEYVGANFYGGDTAYTTVQIVDYPSINLPVQVLDSTLCHEQSIDIIIDSSAMNVNYTLYDFQTGSIFGTSTAGNGGILNFTSSLLSDSGYYYIRAESTIHSVCGSDFTDSIHIAADQTTANLHVGLINAEIGESVPYYEQCRDAHNYAWTFAPNAVVGTSNIPDPLESFNANGTTTVKLVCWSNNGCYDSILKGGPKIFTLPTNLDSCWLNLNDAVDPPWMGGTLERISSIAPGASGYFETGMNDHQQIFGTQHGDPAYIELEGGHLIKNDWNGTNKWLARTDGIVHSVVEDLNQDLYVTVQELTYFIDNSGDSVAIGTYIGGVLIKLDSLGRIIWHRSSNKFWPYKVAIDNSNNLLVSLRHVNDTPGTFQATPLKLNGIVDDTIGIHAPDLSWGMMKLMPTGTILWDIVLDKTGAYTYSNEMIEFDDLNNIYFNSHFGIETSIYEPDGTLQEITFMGSGDSGTKASVTKLNPNGFVEWTSYLRHAALNSGVNIWGMETDGNGTTYITGKSQINSINSLILVDANSDSTYHNVSGLYISKLNSQGGFEWVTGSNNIQAAHGQGAKLTLFNDEIYVVGGQGDLTVDFYNLDSTELHFPNNAYGHFVLVCDTNSNVHRGFVNGINSNLITNSGDGLITGFLSRPDSSFFLTRNNYVIPNPNYYNEFGIIVPGTNEYEGWTTKFKEGCGIPYSYNYAYTVYDTVCIGSSYTLSNGNIVTINNTTFDTLFYTASNGLDSIITVQIYPEIPQINSITNVANTLTSNASGATYQWVDCNNNYQLLAGATNQQYTPTVDGSYAVIVVDGTCADTSTCIIVTAIGLNESNIETDFSIYPNPAQSELTIIIPGNETKSFVVLDMVGRIVLNFENVKSEDIINIDHLSPGIYRLQSIDLQYNSIVFIKQ